MKYVYLIQSISCPDQRYVGLTANITNRLLAHNHCQSPHTSKFRPWRLVSYVAFSDEERARSFEMYLKTGSGRAFAKKHF